MLALLRRDRQFVLIGLGLICLLSWSYLFYLASNMQTGPSMQTAMQGAAMPMAAGWSITDLAFVFGMWVVMMPAMMIPSAAPFILTFARFKRQHQEGQTPYGSTSLFVLGYLATWTGFSLMATFMQWGLASASLLPSAMGRVNPVLGGAILLAAGVFQWTSLKQACLSHCRTPIGFLLEDWQEGGWGAFKMGLKHGSYCTGCCWALMVLMFVAGVMNVFWMALLAGLILIEKAAPWGDRVGRIAGIGLAAWGVWLLAAAL